MSIKEGLTSWDPELLKKAKATAKGKVTLSYKLVRHALVRNNKEDFFLEDMDGTEVEEKYPY